MAATRRTNFVGLSTFDSQDKREVKFNPGIVTGDNAQTWNLICDNAYFTHTNWSVQSAFKVCVTSSGNLSFLILIVSGFDGNCTISSNLEGMLLLGGSNQSTELSRTMSR